MLENLLIVGAAVAGCAALTIVLTLLGIVIIELAPEHVRRLKAWIRGFKPQRRLSTHGPMLAA